MIAIMEQSEGALVAVQFSGELTAADYTDIWMPACEKAIEEHGKVRVLVYMDESFEGWETAVVWEDTKFGLKNLTHFEKIAVVGGAGWIGKVSGLVGNLIPGMTVRSFATGELDEAFDWIK
ncbi:MAG: STAS/SEC14 domain-containing protein [Deltaproteobacteria bacterium]|nr:STAS/SEC14 domain-containing protein [Deltaproteobacteria bacterium]